MKKRFFILACTQLVLAIVSAMLLTKMSFVGRMGISLLYRQYQMLKDPVKTTLVIFGIQLTILVLLTLSKQLTDTKLFRLICITFILLGIGGLTYTYFDFTTTSHKHMKLYFHLGGYTFWLGWFITCFSLLFLKKKRIGNSELEMNEETQTINTKIE